MARFAWIVIAVCACSGDDAHHQQTIPPKADPAPPVAGSGSAVTAPAVAQTLSTTLTEDEAAPYFADGDAGSGAQRFALQDWQGAVDALSRARASATGDTAARLDLLLGLAHQHLGAHADAARELASAASGMPVIRDWIAAEAARAQYDAHLATAEATARSVDRASIAGADAELLIGDILHDRGDAPAIAAHYSDYLARRGDDAPHLSEARFRLAEADETLGKRADAIARDRTIHAHDPLSTWATKADARLAALGDTMPYSVADQLARAMVLFDSMRNPESEAAFAAVLADAHATPADRCVASYHAAQARFKARKYTDSAPMFDDALAACKTAGDKDLQVKSAYQAGRAYAYGKDPHVAAARYQTAGSIDPKHSYADDAMLREAEEYAVLGDDAKLEATLTQLPKKFPDGDNVAESQWRLGWHYWRKQSYSKAIAAWQEQIKLVPHDDSYFGEGEPQYWLGRAYAVKKEPAKAIASWQDCIRSYPGSYYALQALNRLRETSPKDFEAMVAEISADPKGYDPKAPAFTFKPRAEYATPGFARAITFLKLGLGEPAERELHRIGLTVPHDKKRVDDLDQIEKLWAIVFLYDRAGRYASSHWPTRWHILDYRTQWPVGANRARWEIAYPKAYWELLSRHAALNKVPIAMQIGIVREESAFDPLDESYANAIGLTQMIPTTAHDFSQGTGIDPTRENLRDPEKNVTIGSRFLGSLYKDWHGFTLLVPTSYNAGPAGVRKMLRARGTWDGDEFVEGIVDDQARNYTKRVLASFFTYSWLYEHVVPEIGNTIPADLIPAAKKK
jgi:soluble lytic murein transglycosylase|nr:transglycosylase SLT domain-containing protein [Kofleriaceae bacterium]